MDDMIGVAGVGPKAHQMNAAINIKSAEKRLQFSDSKCKSMLIGKKIESSINNNLKVDKWQVEHKEENGEINLVETFLGEVPIEEAKEQKYLGFILSNTGNNMKNITDKKQKSIWIIRKIFNKLYSLNLRKYFFECAVIFLNVMLRSSILYASETYYNLKEGEIRAIERIEESFLRQLLKTSKGCPIAQLYLETGHQPARFEIIRRRLLFLKNILHEKPNSTLYKFIKLQFENPRRGDWMSSCLSDLEFLEIKISLNELECMNMKEFKKILEKSLKIKCYNYLMDKRGKKGIEIKYASLGMAEYLLPNDELTISEQRYVFSMRNRTKRINNNFPENTNKSTCLCGKIEDMKHIYCCKIYNNENEEEEQEYEKIFENNVRNIKKIYEKFKKNFEKREQKQEDNKPRILNVDPLYYNCTAMEIN